MSKKIRTAIFGVGNCASALIQGVSYYRETRAGESVVGLMHADLGGYLPRDIEFCAAFDIDARKVGVDLSQAIFAPPNNTRRFAEVPPTDVVVQQGNLLDGVGRYTEPMIPLSGSAPVDVEKVLRDSGTEVALCYLPVGSEKAVRWYAERCLAAGCALINCMPVFLASTVEWQRLFLRKGLPIIGDDIKSQVGATIVHRLLVDLFRQRGVRLDRTYQLNFGGNTDFLNMLERDRLISKKISKTNAVTSQIGRKIPEASVHVGPSDYVEWLEDRKFCHIRLEGCGFGESPISCEVKLEVWDSPNSAGVVIDAIRCAKLALDRQVAGALIGPSSYFMKSPPMQFTDEEARRLTERFIGSDQSADVEPPIPEKVQVSGVQRGVAAKR
jgi:myo-inositol-1-phosphate synthase